jgi:hypothetical protein
LSLGGCDLLVEGVWVGLLVTDIEQADRTSATFGRLGGAGVSARANSIATTAQW